MRRLVPLIFLAFFLFLRILPGQETGAMLLRGPKVGKGIDYFGPNAIPYERGDYRYNGGTVTVYYILRHIPVLPEWRREACGRTPLFVLEENRESVFLFDSAEGWYVLFVFSKEESKRCPFVVPFLERLRFFRASAADSGSPLPAVVEIR
jgi:hypothetical protein